MEFDINPSSMHQLYINNYNIETYGTDNILVKQSGIKEIKLGETFTMNIPIMETHVFYEDKEKFALTIIYGEGNTMIGNGYFL